MGACRFSPRARDDLSDIWDFTAARWGPAQAERYLRQIQAAAAAVAADPLVGTSAEGIRPGYRKYPSGSHFLFYRPVEDRVEIIRILHARMDVPRHF